MCCEMGDVCAPGLRWFSIYRWDQLPVAGCRSPAAKCRWPLMYARDGYIFYARIGTPRNVLENKRPYMPAELVILEPVDN